MLALTGGKALTPCDAILISGRCIVNEGMLTGMAHDLPNLKSQTSQICGFRTVA